MKRFWMIWFIGICWGVFENQYFGWNSLPQSNAELLADGLAFLLMALAVMTLPSKEIGNP